MKGLKPILIILALLIVDQSLKFWIKTHMFLGEEYAVFGQWFKIHFTENEGMAFGLTFGGAGGKLILTLFRIIAVTFISIYLYKIVKKVAPTGLIISISLILAGAMGNIVDSIFYGILFSDSLHQVAEFLPASGGYSSLFYGQVVDMFYFPLFEGILPGWIPFWGGQYFIFFRPVFNIADASITTGVLLIIFFQGSFFKSSTNKGTESQA